MPITLPDKIQAYECANAAHTAGYNYFALSDPEIRSTAAKRRRTNTHVVATCSYGNDGNDVNKPPVDVATAMQCNDIMGNGVFIKTPVSSTTDTYSMYKYKKSFL